MLISLLPSSSEKIIYQLLSYLTQWECFTRNSKNLKELLIHIKDALKLERNSWGRIILTLLQQDITLQNFICHGLNLKKQKNTQRSTLNLWNKRGRTEKKLQRKMQHKLETRKGLFSELVLCDLAKIKSIKIKIIRKVKQSLKG